MTNDTLFNSSNPILKDLSKESISSIKVIESERINSSSVESCSDEESAKIGEDRAFTASAPISNGSASSSARQPPANVSPATKAASTSTTTTGTAANTAVYSSSFAAAVERNQIHISRLLLTSLYVFHVLYPPAKPYTSKFIDLQYPIPSHEVTLSAEERNGNTVFYDIGFDDIYYIVFWVVTLTFLRSAIMSYVFTPIATNLCKIRSRKAVTRFAEQGWQNFYYCGSFALGVYLYVGSPYWVMKLDHLYLGWPHYQLSPLFKKYYLISIAFWVHQMIVLNIEEKRKDHVQMFSHHVITFLLLVGSYYYYFGRIGHSILMIMDSVDIFLITAKMLKYSGFNTLCDVLFILFMVSWIVLRHGVYNVLFYHAYLNAGPMMNEMKCAPGLELKRCWSPRIINVFLLLLGGLQIITIVWMYFISKVAYKVISGSGGAEDVRSDEDDTEDEEEEEDTAEHEKEEEEEAEEI